MQSSYEREQRVLRSLMSICEIRTFKVSAGRARSARARKTHSDERE